MDKKEEFLQRLRATFKVEAEEYLQSLSSSLIELEGGVDEARQRDLIETVFRLAHSLKGAARAVDRADMEGLCQCMENLLSALKRGEQPLAQGMISPLLDAVDLLGDLLAAADSSPQQHEQIKALCSRINQCAQGKAEAAQPAAQTAPLQPVAAPTPSPSAEAPVPPRHAEERMARTDTLRISVAKLDALLLQIETLLTPKLASAQRARDLHDTRQMVAQISREHRKLAADVKTMASVLQDPGRRFDRFERIKGRRRIQKLLEFISWEEAEVKKLEIQLNTLAKTAERDRRSLSSMVDNLLDDMKKALMLPVSSTFDVFPKLVRDLARDSGKEVALSIDGGDIEIDRRILEELRDPLIHLVRNCVDHGIEKPEERARNGKPVRGNITMKAVQRESDQVELCIEDDGAGVALESLRDAAVRLGTRSREEVQQLDGEALLALMFVSGISTSPTITDISGRGLGLAIVREKVEDLGGTIAVETQPRVGTRFHLNLPVTLATYRGVHVCSSGHQFVFPTTQVEQVATIRCDSIRTVENQAMITLNGRALALARLADLLELPRPSTALPESAPVVVAAAAERRIALLVDEVIGEQEVLVKGLGKQLQRVRNVAAATVLGSGSIVPILHVADLIKSAMRAANAGFAVAAAPAEPAQRRSILVAEDSITSRLLIKGVLEAAGYKVTTAVDGEEALTRLRAEPFDLVVSDVDMPRMSGFDLTARIRADSALAALPVILVTALSSREDRERGADVGASAYLVKSSFDQSNLLEVVRRLL